jgi:hypothetical protein
MHLAVEAGGGTLDVYQLRLRREISGQVSLRRFIGHSSPAT